MIAGTSFAIGDFERIWPQYQMRAARGIKDDAVHDAREKLRIGRAACMVGHDGMVVFELTGGPRGGMQMLVLLAVSSGIVGAFDRQERAMLAVAKDIGVTELAFKTWRPGWAKVLGDEWQHDGDTFTREV